MTPFGNQFLSERFQSTFRAVPEQSPANGTAFLASVPSVIWVKSSQPLTTKLPSSEQFQCTVQTLEPGSVSEQFKPQFKSGSTYWGQNSNICNSGGTQSEQHRLRAIPVHS